MKTLEQLGISPAPWRVDNSVEDGVIVRDAKGKWAAAPDGKALSNARLIAAAPKLYEVCYRIERWEGHAKAYNKAVEPWSDIIHDMHKALAEAAGEEVRDGK